MRADLVFRGATVVDGRGVPPFNADVAVGNGKILAVGPGLSVEGAREINAAGKHLMPGWVDLHTHFDVQCTFDPLLLPAGPAGVTTVVFGSCGVGAAPTRKDGQQFMIDQFSSVEDIPGEVIRKGTKWTVGDKRWESFPEFLEMLSGLDLACDIAAMIPHGPVRGYVLGPERANLSDRPHGPWENPITRQEKEAIAACVKEAIEAGAVGFSVNRFVGHRDVHGVMSAGTLADVDEIVLCAKGVAEAGGGVLQMHNDFKSYDDIPEDKMELPLREQHFKREWAWMEFVSKEYGLPVSWLTGDPDRIAKANARGAKLTAQTLVRPQSLIMSWEARMHPFKHTALFRKMKREVPVAQWPERLSNLEFRSQMIGQALKHYSEDTRLSRFYNEFFGLSSWQWRSRYSMDPDFDYEPPPEKSIRAIADSTGRSVLDIAYDALMENGCKGVIWQAQSEDVTSQYEQIRHFLLQPNFVPGISDAGAHLAIHQDGISSTSMISFWARDRKRGKKLPLEFCVQKQARDTAYLFGFFDRGTIEVGKKADLNLVDMERLRILPPEPAYDLPAGAFRWHQRAEGYDMTLVSGQVTFENGRHTGAFPGRLVRNPHAAGRRSGLPDVPAEFVGYRRGVVSTGEATTAQNVLDSALNATGGASRNSAITLAMEKEAQSEERQRASKL